MGLFLSRYTQDSPDLLDTTDPNSLYATHFNPSHPTKVIIHGFQGGRNLAPSTDLREGEVFFRVKIKLCTWKEFLNQKSVEKTTNSFSRLFPLLNMEWPNNAHEQEANVRTLSFTSL